MPFGNVARNHTGIAAGRPVLRFAPSPTGHLHLGHALSALTNLDWARRLDAHLLVRIEDTDLTRCRPEFEASILEDLAWLGISSDCPVLRQSEHFAVYRAAVDKLASAGLVYPCFASRQEIQDAGRPGMVDPDGAPLYPGIWRGANAAEVERRKAGGEPFALRLDMEHALSALAAVVDITRLDYIGLDTALRSAPVGARPERWGDVILWRKDGSPAYHLAVVVDDARQGVTHVVRGADLEAATDVHRLLQALLDLPPPVYHHHRLVLGPDGRKFSKRSGDTSLASLRRQGWTLGDIRRAVGLEPATN